MLSLSRLTSHLSESYRASTTYAIQNEVLSPVFMFYCGNSFFTPVPHSTLSFSIEYRPLHSERSNILTHISTVDACLISNYHSQYTKNDFHARYVEMTSGNSRCSPTAIASDECFGGIARVKAGFDKLKCDLRIQAGDFVQGTVYDTIFSEDIAIAGYKWVDYDFAVLGNHEFDMGPDPIFNTVLNTPRNLEWIVSNVNFTSAPSNFLERINLALDTFGICWVSALTSATNIIAQPGPDTIITNETIGITTAIGSCKQQKRVIAINHQGFEKDLEMCKNVKEIDLIIGAHSHTNLDNGQYPVKVEREDGSVCWVTQAFAFGRYIGMLDVDFDDDGNISFTGHAYYPLDSRVENDAAVAEKLAVFTSQLDEEVQVKVAEAAAFIDGSRKCRQEECEMGNMACDALLDWAGERQGAVGCIQNGGSVRGSMEEGDITVEDVLTVFPFGNVHVVITLPGSGLLAALEHGFTAVDGDDIRGRFPQVGGMVVTVDLDGAPFNRITSVVIDGEPLVEDKIYKIVTNSFIASGGDGYVWPGATEFEFSGRALSELSQEYLEANSPYSPMLEGRLVL